jgi:hypothetical protein
VTSPTLVQAIESHKKLLQKKQQELAEFMSTYKIQVKSGNEDEQQAAEGNQGLLVS